MHLGRPLTYRFVLASVSEIGREVNATTSMSHKGNEHRTTREHKGIIRIRPKIGNNNNKQ